MDEKWEGKVISEEEAAKSLGYQDVFEFRRASTEQGREVERLKNELRLAKTSLEDFKITINRMHKTLEMVEPLLADQEILHVLRIVIGKETDWGGVYRKKYQSIFGC